MSSLFTTIKKRIEKVSTPRKVTVDGVPKMIVDGVEMRVDVFTADFERLRRRLEKVK